MIWTSVKDSMPEYAEECLIIIEDMKPPIFYHVVEWRNRWITLTDGEDLNNNLIPTHWTYLPEPPKEVLGEKK